MKARMALTAALIGSALLWSSGQAAGSPAVTILFATPYEGHSGGLIDLSGSGFKRYRALDIFMACPSYSDPTVYQYNNFTVQIPGPTTDAAGEFAGFLFHAPNLSHVPSTGTMGCQIYVAIPQDRQAYGEGVVPGTFTIVPNHKRLKRCVRTLCVKSVIASPKRVRVGLKEHIAVKGWPGARVDAELSYPNGVVEHHIRHLDWKGRYSFTETVPAIASSQASVKITVIAELGRMKDTRVGSFTVTR